MGICKVFPYSLFNLWLVDFTELRQGLTQTGRIERDFSMDTIEQLHGTYFYNGLSNLTARELFFFVFLEEAHKQFGVADISALALIILGQPTQSTRGKPVGATKGTSILSENLRRWLKYRIPRWPTLTTESIRHLRFSYVTNLGAFAGRWIPILGIVFVMNDVYQISFKTVCTYNRIVRKGDKVW